MFPGSFGRLTSALVTECFIASLFPDILQLTLSAVIGDKATRKYGLADVGAIAIV